MLKAAFGAFYPPGTRCSFLCLSSAMILFFYRRERCGDIRRPIYRCSGCRNYLLFRHGGGRCRRRRGLNDRLGSDSILRRRHAAKSPSNLAFARFRIHRSPSRDRESEQPDQYSDRSNSSWQQIRAFVYRRTEFAESSARKKRPVDPQNAFTTLGTEFWSVKHPLRGSYLLYRCNKTEFLK